ncbi:aldehyde reductase [Penicillium capsulatum]|uniref:Aldehyde reductase n=1 Tax=Penicillium capsulatum TaxID=69766 RepID=A0A9W9HZ92_9EURO|nr:aldehyde reductase [Penicillium capsulatum]
MSFTSGSPVSLDYCVFFLTALDEPLLSATVLLSYHPNTYGDLLHLLGISNFTKEETEEILHFAEIKPAVNQIEAHPYLQQPDLLEWSQKHGIVVAVYSPPPRKQHLRPSKVHRQLGGHSHRSRRQSLAQVLVQSAVQRGTVVLPKSVTPSRIAENFADFEVPASAMDRINAFDRKHRYNMPIRLGVNIFGGHAAEKLRRGRQDWTEKQRELKGR